MTHKSELPQYEQEQIAEQTAAVLKARNLTQCEAADEIGVTQQTVSVVINDILPNLRTYMLVRDWLALPENQKALKQRTRR